MRAAGFCSECGEKINVKRRLVPARLYCAQCAPRFRIARFVITALALLCLGAGFIAGWYTKSREPFYFIGTPVDLASNRASVGQRDARSAGASSAETSEVQDQKPAGDVETLCGAPTKSGRPCRRKVRGGGYCYQHRDKFPPKPNAGEKTGGKE